MHPSPLPLSLLASDRLAAAKHRRSMLLTNCIGALVLTAWLAVLFWMVNQ